MEMDSDQSKEELAQRVKDLFGKTLRARVTDSRVVEGQFECLDREMNVVLSGAREFHCVDSVNFKESSNMVRSIGMAIIPGETIESIVLLK